MLCCRASLHTQRPRRSISRPTAPSAAYFELLSVDSAMLRAPAREGSSQRTQIRMYVGGLCATVTTVLLRDRTDRVRRDLVLDHRRPAVSCHWQQPPRKRAFGRRRGTLAGLSSSLSASLARPGGGVCIGTNTIGPNNSKFTTIALSRSSSLLIWAPSFC